jgi:hypothetical protein
MAAQPEIGRARVGLIVAFDADTGEVLHVHEKVVETVDDVPGCATEITSDECNEIRRMAAQEHCTRRVDVITEMGPSEEDDLHYRYHVDPMTRELRAERQVDPRRQAEAIARCYPREP